MGFLKAVLALLAVGAGAALGALYGAGPLDRLRAPLASGEEAAAEVPCAPEAAPRGLDSAERRLRLEVRPRGGRWAVGLAGVGRPVRTLASQSEAEGFAMSLAEAACPSEVSVQAEAGA